MTYLQQLRGLDLPVLLLDGGDVFFRTATRKRPSRSEISKSWRKARTLLSAYNLLGYQAIAIGPTDLQLGLSRLQTLEKLARFPFLCANLVDSKTKEPYFKPYEIIEVAGVRLGVYSVVQQQYNPSYAKRVFPDGEVLDPVEVTGQVLNELKGKCDVIVGLSHLGEKLNIKILEKYPEIDVMVDPLTRFGSKTIWVSDEEDYCREVHGTPRLRIDGQGSRVGVFEMHVGLDTRKISKYVGYNVPLEPHLMDHPTMVDLVKQVQRGGVAMLSADFDPTKPLPNSDLMGHEACGGCHEEQHDFWKDTRHASNFDTLVPSNNEMTPNCIGCHTLGYGIAFARPSDAVKFKEVQCENCHGAKPKHAEDPSAHRFGGVKESTCLGCHNPEHTGRVADGKPGFTSKLLNYKEALPLASCPKMSQ